MVQMFCLEPTIQMIYLDAKAENGFCSFPGVFENRRVLAKNVLFATLSWKLDTGIGNPMESLVVACDLQLAFLGII